MPDCQSSSTVVLGFDFGIKRIGVAIGYAEVGVANPLAAICVEDNVSRFKAIDALIQEWKPGRLLVGMPTHADGTSHDMTLRAARFARQLKARFHLPVEMVDERFTSLMAEQMLKESRGGKSKRNDQKGHVDSLSALQIVQDYLEGLPS